MSGELKGPRNNTRFALFAVSGNQCAFPDCTAAVYEDGSIVGDICHIIAQSPGGPRYETGMSDQEIHGIDNLILLCKKHHKIVDDHPDKYTTAWLLDAKSTHTAAAGDVATDLLHSLLDALSGDPMADLSWWDHPDGPALEVRPGQEQVPGNESMELLMQFQVRGGRVGALRGRWRGPGVDMEPTDPMPENQAGKFQMKAVSVVPDADKVEVHFEITFMWIDGKEHGCRWSWPVQRHAKGHWMLQSHEGTGLQPANRW